MSFEWVVEGLLLSIVAVVSKNQFSGFSSFSIFIQVFQSLLICFQFLSNVFHFYSIFYFLCWEHFLAAFLILHFIFLLYNFINFIYIHSIYICILSVFIIFSHLFIFCQFIFPFSLCFRRYSYYSFGNWLCFYFFSVRIDKVHVAFLHVFLFIMSPLLNIHH